MFHPFDPLLFVLWFGLKGPPVWRHAVLVLGLLPALMWAMPARPCGCMAIPFQRCSSYGRESAYFAAMKSDLKNLASQEEIYFSDFAAYSADAAELGFVTSYGVEVTVHASMSGWAARAEHVALGEAESCAVYWGAPTRSFAQLDRVEPGELVCTNDR